MAKALKAKPGPQKRTIRKAAASSPLPLGSGKTYRWAVTAKHVDMAVAEPGPAPLAVRAAPQNVTLDLARTAMIVIDMQNDFCAKSGWVDHLGVDYTPDRAPIKPLAKLLPKLRAAGVPVIWVNWGNRPDLMNMAPNQHHLYKPTGRAIGRPEPPPGYGPHAQPQNR